MDPAANDVSETADDILQIFASEEDVSFNERTSGARASGKNSENVVLKFIIAGSNVINSVFANIFDFVSGQLGINITAIYFKGDKSVLFEVPLDNNLKDWLVKLFEERNTSQPLGGKARDSILNICSGKFKIVFETFLVNMILIPYADVIRFPCQSSCPTYGLCNENIFNLTANVSPTTINAQLKKILLSTEGALFLKSVCGLRFERKDDVVNKYKLRLIMKRIDLSQEMLKFLNNTFQGISFSPLTVHTVPKLLKLGVEEAIGRGQNMKSTWEMIYRNDIIFCGNNESRVFRKGVSKEGAGQKSTKGDCGKVERNLLPAGVNTKFRCVIPNVEEKRNKRDIRKLLDAKSSKSRKDRKRTELSSSSEDNKSKHRGGSSDRTSKRR